MGERMGRSLVDCVSLDGMAVTLSGVDVDLSGAFTSTAVFTRRGRQHQFSGGVRDFAETVAREVAGVALTEAYSVLGGEVLCGSTSEAVDGLVMRTRVGVWRGTETSLFTHLSGPSTTQELLDLFAAFSISDHSSGIQMSPRSGRGLRLDAPATVILYVPRVGVIESEPFTRRNAHRVPQYQGTPVRGGELFVSGRGSPREHFLLVTDSAVATISPDEGSDMDAVAAALEEFEVIIASRS